ncbi:MAG: thioredoxin domain-containing protein, partial [Chloroflexi bacterium]|nr:thioredoxin domain-containing protein [Chloroflexota bacterium]
INTGKARLTYFHYTVVDSNTGGNESHRAAEASECAAQQGKFWEMHDVLFANQKGEGIGTFGDRRLIEMAKMAPGLDQDAFESCFKSGGGRAAVQADLAIATRRSIQGTPTIFVNGVQVQNPLDLGEFQRLIDPLAPASR